ncbi:hypothetical protein [Nocardiopsis aegyptia]|uniref:Uncharacterized protein n=1 Tax=Nocardiopsis aegyptia TaxID=220378 RepID=A0A7Z0J8M3_9ACTN|nr:hypothetical protein [Nocardiopsis aegyptia]NYJ32882.1 hypothetical protein [Nocardiopsis aegyptia]
MWKWLCAAVLGVIALILVGFWAAPRLWPDLGLGLDELNQLAGIVSLPVGVASLLVGLWALRSPSGSPASPGGVTNTITGNPTGPTVQAHTVTGGVGNTTHHHGGGDHIDVSGGTFHDKVVGKEEHHHRPDTPDDTGSQ